VQLPDDFYDEQSEASQIKARIVTKYFRFWSKVMIPHGKGWAGGLAYFDLYAGPGRYADGTPSTPILILEQAVENPDLCRLLTTIFNDHEHSNQLRENIGTVAGIERLAHRPQVYEFEVDSEVAKIFSKPLPPSFSFIDPFGYKGVTLQLLRAMLKDWGCDLILFFSYARINAAIDNDIFEAHTIALFGERRLISLREKIRGKRPSEREALILESFSQALAAMGFPFVLPFSFKRPGQERTSHHLIFVTKGQLAYTVMKEIMASESSEFDQGVPSFAYSKSLSEYETPLLFSLDRPLEGLADDLMDDFNGQTMKMQQIFEQHHVGKRYVVRNYRAALIKLEADEKIIADPPASKRPRRNNGPTFGPNVLVTFPKKKR
jgi:three-Cys-motif partner protein